MKTAHMWTAIQFRCLVLMVSQKIHDGELTALYKQVLRAIGLLRTLISKHTSNGNFWSLALEINLNKCSFHVETICKYFVTVEYRNSLKQELEHWVSLLKCGSTRLVINFFSFESLSYFFLINSPLRPLAYDKE